MTLTAFPRGLPMVLLDLFQLVLFKLPLKTKVLIYYFTLLTFRSYYFCPSPSHAVSRIYDTHSGPIANPKQYLFVCDCICIYISS